MIRRERIWRVRNSRDSVPDTHQRFAWCGQCPYPAGMRVTGYGRLPISGQSLRKAFLSVLCASSEAGGEPNWFWGFDSADEDWRRNRL